MKHGYSINADQVIVDYSSVYCETVDKLLRSKPFEHILHRYMENLAAKHSHLHSYLLSRCASANPLVCYRTMLELLKLLCNQTAAEVSRLNKTFARFLQEPQMVYEFVEGLYDFWRSYERYIVLMAPRTRGRTRDSIHHAQFIKANETLRQLILHTYRTVCENLINTPFRVYRQLPAGAQVGILNQTIQWDCPAAYRPLSQIPFIRLTLLEPPVIFYPKKNTRSGLFKEVPANPLAEIDINPKEWFCYPAKIGKLLAFAYFHKRFMSHGVSLANLFELANYQDIVHKRPDILLLFGAPAPQFTEDKSLFYHDHENHLMNGYVVHDESVDYFGYMKKMLLTLHNIIMLERGLLPLHGAMVAIRLRNQAAANIVIVGDSGAGKSETLEAFRILAQDHISEMDIIFDDMGAIAWEQEAFKAYGTEIGAFLRLDDLQKGYAFQQMDRSIFMNPHLTNARVILPVTSYKNITRGYSVDYFLYANNYELVDAKTAAITQFDAPESALRLFSDGKRMAKGTTSEKGLVESYFANPFGAPQRRQRHEELAAELMARMFKKGVFVGQIRTQLGIEGREQEGPQMAARALFNLMSQRSSAKKPMV